MFATDRRECRNDEAIAHGLHLQELRPQLGGAGDRDALVQMGFPGLRGGYGAVPMTVRVHSSEQQQRLRRTFSFGWLLRFLCFLEGVSLLVGCLIPAPVLALYITPWLMWGPLVGYLAISKFRTGGLVAYLLYFLLRIATDAALIATGYFWFAPTLFPRLPFFRRVCLFLRAETGRYRCYSFTDGF